MPAKLVETLPAAWYCDPEIYEAERRRIFARNWHLIANGGRLARPGSYVTGEVAGWPVFAVRDRDGELRAFHNVCRHRAGPIFNDEGGVCRALRCRYHGWLYGFDGVLRYAPGIAAPETLDKASFSLFPVRVETWQDLVFVCLDREAPSLHEWMGDVNLLVEPFPNQTDFAFHGEKTYDGRCDWKAYGDNSCEGYHLPLIHPELNRAVSSSDIRPFENGGFVGFDIGYRGTNAARSDRGVWIYKFPSLLVHYAHNAINVEQVSPRGPGRISIRSLYWVPEGELALGDDYRLDSDRVIGEDMGVCEAVQRNLESGLYGSGRLCEDKEPGTIFFQRLVREGLEMPPVELGSTA